MNSLSFSPAIFNIRNSAQFHPPTPTTTFNKHLAPLDSSTIKFSSQDSGNSQSLGEIVNPTIYRRRDAIGLGLLFSFVEFSFRPPSVSAAEDAAGTFEFTSTPSGLAYYDNVVGYGALAVKGQLIKAHYVGKLENGKVFDSSYNRGKPLTFRVGVGEVIKGWDQGILGGEGIPPMLSGGKRTLRIPPELGYGMRGAGCKGGTCIIPPNSVLLFDVEFIGKA